MNTRKKTKYEIKKMSSKISILYDTFNMDMLIVCHTCVIVATQ